MDLPGQCVEEAEEGREGSQVVEAADAPQFQAQEGPYCLERHRGREGPHSLAPSAGQDGPHSQHPEV